MPRSAIRPLGWRDAFLLVFGYLALDWASHIHFLHGLDVTPWSPAPALGLLFLVRHGKQAAPPLALAILAADAWTRELALPGLLAVGLALQLTAGYWLTAHILRLRLGSKGFFVDRRGLIDWVTIAVVGTLLNGLLFFAGLTLGGYLSQAAASEALLPHLLGDVVGVLISMPLLAMLLDARGRARLRRLLIGRESLSLLTTGGALAFTFVAGEMTEFKYFPVLFLPIAWAAARQGLAGAVLTVGLTQVGIVLASRLLGFSWFIQFELEVLVLVLALAGYFIGIVVDEKQRLSAELQQTLRLAAAGEMAGALSHELHQPLTALLAYTRACQQLLAQGESGQRLFDVIDRVVAESQRAADVVSRLRDFFRTGTTRLERIELRELLASAVARFLTQARQQGVELRLLATPACALWADRLQLEVVLRNLLANAFEATAERPLAVRQVRVSAEHDGAGRVCITVEDSGPGVSEEMVEHLFEAFHSSKASGLGLGLAISRAIVEAHGGSLWAEVGERGLFRLLLPVEEASAHAI
ncbi:MAG TPA: ATP-binding protein [Accumulibacter sp.]|uniref:ATP-binding protein n=1 Tax=Accumulibacter sp. TaxID=2053492 RepID=UPI002C659FCD|nr:ATP-binding protein [Accumulibacter sp.]HNB67720.1 ATP-binding protein [Accumulibacter sp.]HND38358.1 ATP-binding protein [Accumulibacter sp.]HNH90858.1 ATP-binding protein [Accumulibacter sp.]HNJ49539.1 ATP-binding protein [Accumulibacter sp.]